jgi:hypothetical protein
MPDSEIGWDGVLISSGIAFWIYCRRLDARYGGSAMSYESPREVSGKFQIEAAVTMLITTLFEMLIEKGHLHQGEVMARLEKSAAEAMVLPNSSRTIGYIDIVRDHIAGEVVRKPS